MGGGCTASGSGGGAWEPVSTARCERTCPVALPSLHWQRRLIAEFGVLPSGSCANKTCCHPTSVYKTLKKNLYETNTWFFRWKRFWNKQKLQPIIECKWPLVLGQDDSAQCCKSSFNDKYITAPHHADLELSSIPALRLALQMFTTQKKIIQYELPLQELPLYPAMSFFVSLGRFRAQITDVSD